MTHPRLGRWVKVVRCSIRWEPAKKTIHPKKHPLQKSWYMVIIMSVQAKFCLHFWQASCPWFERDRCTLWYEGIVWGIIARGSILQEPVCFMVQALQNVVRMFSFFLSTRKGWSCRERRIKLYSSWNVASFQIYRCSHFSQLLRYLRERWPQCRIRRPTTLHQGLPFGITPGRNFRSYGVVHNAPWKEQNNQNIS